MKGIICGDRCDDGEHNNQPCDDNNAAMTTMATKKISKIADKLDKVNESFTVNMYDNGFMIEIGGRKNDDWKTAKVMCQTLEQVYAVISEASTMTRD